MWRPRQIPDSHKHSSNLYMKLLGLGRAENNMKKKRSIKQSPSYYMQSVDGCAGPVIMDVVVAMGMPTSNIYWNPQHSGEPNTARRRVKSGFGSMGVEFCFVLFGSKVGWSGVNQRCQVLEGRVGKNVYFKQFQVVFASTRQFKSQGTNRKVFRKTFSNSPCREIWWHYGIWMNEYARGQNKRTQGEKRDY